MESTIRPWYRSRLFWLGVPGLLFLVWAWGDSMRQEASVTRLAPARTVVVSSIGGLLKCEVYQDDEGSGEFNEVFTNQMNIRGYERNMEDPGNGGDEDVVRYVSPKSGAGFALTHPIQWFQPPVTFGQTRTDWVVSPWSFRLAYWFVVLGYISIWCFSIVWWQSRKFRKDSNQ